MQDSFETLSGETRHRLKVERSIFIGIAFRISSEAEFFARRDEISREHFDATHHCWAFRLRQGESLRVRSSDAGEPNGTAGKPILAAIEAALLENVAVVVVRHFGGVKLGTGGLARAYRQCASETLERAPREPRFLYETIVIEVPYETLNVVYRLVDPPNVVLEREEFGDRNEFTFNVRTSRLADLEHELREKRIRFRRGDA